MQGLEAEGIAILFMTQISSSIINTLAMLLALWAPSITTAEEARIAISAEQDFPSGIRSDAVVNAIYTYGDDALQLTFEELLSAKSQNYTEAAVVIYPNLPEWVRMAIEHSEAIQLGRENYIREALLRDERYAPGGRLSSERIQSRLAGYQERYGVDTVEGIQSVVAGKSFDETMQNILNGNVSSEDTLFDLVGYSPDFVKTYLMDSTFWDEFPQEKLSNALRILEAREWQEAAANRIREAQEWQEAAREAIEEEFRNLVEKLERARATM